MSDSSGGQAERANDILLALAGMRLRDPRRPALVDQALALANREAEESLMTLSRALAAAWRSAGGEAEAIVARIRDAGRAAAILAPGSIPEERLLVQLSHTCADAEEAMNAALRAVSVATAAGRPGIEARLSAARRLKEFSRHDEAAEILRPVFSDVRTRADGGMLLTYVDVLRAAGRLSEAAEILRDANMVQVDETERDPVRQMMLLAHAEVEVQQGNLASADELISRMAALENSLPYALRIRYLMLRADRMRAEGVEDDALMWAGRALGLAGEAAPERQEILARYPKAVT